MQQLSQEQEQDEARAFLHQVASPIANSPPGGWPNFSRPVEHNLLYGYTRTPELGSLSPVGSLSPLRSNHLPGLASILPSNVLNPVEIAPLGKCPVRSSQVNPVITKASATHGVAFQNHYSVLDHKLSSSPVPTPFGDSSPSSIGTLSGPEFLWGSPTIPTEPMKTSTTSSSLKGRPFPSSGQGIGFSYATAHGSFPGTLHHGGSAPSGIPLERRFGFFPESSESYINQTAFGLTSFGLNGNHAVNNGTPGAMNIGAAFAGNFTKSGSPSSRMMSISTNGHIYFGNGSFGTTSHDGILDHGRTRRVESGNQMDNKKQYQLDLEKIKNGEDTRTTLMIKSIPNKYTSQMLLAAIDETHKSTYDFLYLPIDFKNKCNVGYAFINMVSPSHITSFYEAFNGKKWEKFNSEKVSSLAYAIIQGKVALVSHFQNSSLMNEDKRCRPILFQSEGQLPGDQEPLPSGNLNIFIRQTDGPYSGDSLDSPKGDPYATVC